MSSNMCRPWCPGSRSCVGPQQLMRNCAGPLELTGEDNIGTRPCCGGMIKCQDQLGLRTWCSSTGKCPGNANQTFDYTTDAPQPFRNYSDKLVFKEKFCLNAKTTFEGVL
jgi:hypothetical protein